MWLLDDRDDDDDDDDDGGGGVKTTTTFCRPNANDVFRVTVYVFIIRFSIDIFRIAVVISMQFAPHCTMH